MLALTFPAIDPVAFAIGPVSIRWYALAYIAGILLGWRYMIWIARREQSTPGGAPMTDRDVDDFVVWATLGVILGGRIGYILFYQPAYFLANPLAALAVWQGGMSFHGGLTGVFLATLLFARKRGISWLSVCDLAAAAAPIGLCLGRIANFINGELFGRVTASPLGMVFPNGGPLPRHPSQLYEAALEGVVLFAILAGLVFATRALSRPGTIGAVFLIGYGVARMVVELFRAPDAHIGFLAGGLTMGQLLSLPLVLAGLVALWWVRRRPAP